MKQHWDLVRSQDQQAKSSDPETGGRGHQCRSQALEGPGGLEFRLLVAGFCSEK